MLSVNHRSQVVYRISSNNIEWFIPTSLNSPWLFTIISISTISRLYTDRENHLMSTFSVVNITNAICSRIARCNLTWRISILISLSDRESIKVTTLSHAWSEVWQGDHHYTWTVLYVGISDPVFTENPKLLLGAKLNESCFRFGIEFCCWWS